MSLHWKNKLILEVSSLPPPVHFTNVGSGLCVIGKQIIYFSLILLGTQVVAW